MLLQRVSVCPRSGVGADPGDVGLALHVRLWSMMAVDSCISDGMP